MAIARIETSRLELIFFCWILSENKAQKHSVILSYWDRLRIISDLYRKRAFKMYKMSLSHYLDSYFYKFNPQIILFVLENLELLKASK